MAERNPEVFAMIEAELRQDRAASNEYLFGRAVNLDHGIAELTPQQFNARYPLVIKRKLAREEASSGISKRQNGDRPAVGAAARSTKLSPFLADQAGHAGNRKAGQTRHDRTSSFGSSPDSRRGPKGTRRRIAQAKIEGPTLAFDDAALRTTLLRLMRDVAEAAGGSPGKLVEVVAKVDSYASDVKETARIAP